MAKQSRYDAAFVAKQRAKRKEVEDNPGAENSVPQLRESVRNLEQAVGLRDIP